MNMRWNAPNFSGLATGREKSGSATGAIYNALHTAANLDVRPNVKFGLVLLPEPETKFAMTATTTAAAAAVNGLHRSMSTYNFSIEALLNEASRPQSKYASASNPGRHNDHIIELQLVVAALNRVPYGAYTTPGWQQWIVDFFDQPDNIQEISPEENVRKWRAINAAIQGDQLAPEDQIWIELINAKWNQLSERLQGFDDFKGKLEFIISLPLSAVSADGLKSWPFHR